MKRLTLVPIGGLANRLRAIAASYEYCEQNGYDLKIIWICNRELNCRWGELFEPLPSHIEVKNVSWYYSLKYGLPRLKNLYIPSLFHRFCFDRVLYQINTEDLLDDNILKDDAASVLSDSVWVCTCYEYRSVSPDTYKKLFTPVSGVSDLVAGYVCQFNENTFGLHVRRSDNIQSINASPLRLFEEKMDAILGKYSDARFFVATDSEEVKEHLKDKYGKHRIIAAATEADRESKHGMVAAAAELFALTETKYFYGSYYSSFSDMVLCLNSSNGEILSEKV